MDATVASWLERLRRLGPRRRRRGEPDAAAAELDALCRRLEDGLGPFGYQWLCACAVYPGLRLPITSYLGAELAREVGRPVPDEAEHMALARLPWFREGWMPDALRLRLLRGLEPQLRPVVRTAIERLIHDAAGQSEQPELAEPPEIARLPDGWSKGFREALRTRARAAASEDQIFVRYMLGGVPSAADLELSRRLTRIFGARLAGWLDRRTLLGAATAILAPLAIALYGGSLLRPWFDVIRQQVGTVESTFRECPRCPEMAVVPAGRFMMGATATEGFPLAEPQHLVSVADFALGRTLVTFDDWAACVAEGGCGKYAPSDAGWGRGKRPVIFVSWNDAQGYVAWLAGKTGRPYRLPSEAEWEYAARGGTTTAYPWGDDWDRRLANGADSVGRTTVVATYAANPTGFYDMIGNVWEWVEDCWHDNFKGAPADGKAWVDAGGCKPDWRLVRGGSWSVGPSFLRVAFRVGSQPAFRFDYLGLRVARTLTAGGLTPLPLGGSGGAAPGRENFPAQQQQTTPPKTGQPAKGR
jgi:formylglycine-generating enzyme required for sulfatase activity